MIIFNCSFLSYLTFILLFSFVIVLVLNRNFHVGDKVNKVVVVVYSVLHVILFFFADRLPNIFVENVKPCFESLVPI